MPEIPWRLLRQYYQVLNYFEINGSLLMFKPDDLHAGTFEQLYSIAITVWPTDIWWVQNLFPYAACLREVWPRDFILREGSTVVARTYCAILKGLLDSIADDYDEGS